MENRFFYSRLVSSLTVIVSLFLFSSDLHAGERFQPDPWKNQDIIVSSTWNKINNAVSNLEKRVGKGLIVVSATATGIPSYLYVSGEGRALPMNSISTGSEGPGDIANMFLQEYKDIFGISAPAVEMRISRVSDLDILGMRQIRYQQHYDGIPVVGGEIIVHLNSNNDVTMVNGEYLPDIRLDVNPGISQEEMFEILRKAVLLNHNLKFYEVTAPELRVLNLGLLQDYMDKTHLVYHTTIKGVSQDGKPVKEKYYIDAHFGGVVFHYSEIHDALDRLIYNASGGTLPGVQVRTEGGPPTGDADEDNAYTYAGETYNYYFNTHGRDSLDNAGMSLVVSAHYPNNCPNAFWDGSQTVFCSGLVTRDIMAHELTHGVTDFSANLIYYNQSGALNESYSDIFGSAADGNWTMGEGSAIGIIRDMSNPPAYGDPDKVSSSNYWCSANDGGGVHSNSGVSNKAAYLISDGGAFNGYNITGIGRTKMELIEYRALTTKLTQASDFLDNYNALNTSCQELVGTNGITAANCSELVKALDAVEMNRVAACLSINPDIKANFSNFPITITQTDNLLITGSLIVSGRRVEKWFRPADWWVTSVAPDGTTSYYNGTAWVTSVATYRQSSLVNTILFPPVLNTSGLAIGTWTFSFGIDTIQNGSVDTGALYSDSVVVNVN